MTPQRHDFSYPRGLAPAPRHSALLSQFRKDYILDEAMNTPIPNLSFTESEVKNSTKHCTYTGLCLIWLIMCRWNFFLSYFMTML